MTVHLRGHHLLCMLTWKGCGYTPEFTNNYDELMVRIMNEGTPIKIIDGPDDICKPLTPDNVENYHCKCERELVRDEEALDSINLFLKNHKRPQWKKNEEIYLTAEILKELRAAFKSGEIRKACQTCSFFNFCTEIAESDFEGIRLNIK